MGWAHVIDGALIDRNGRSSARLYAIGPVRYGTLIETTAIPDIREQATALGDLFAASVRRSPVATAARVRQA